MSGLILATYWVRCQHAVLFLWNKMPNSPLKTLKAHAVWGGVAL